MCTGADMVNTGITKTSNLFQVVPGMGPGESSQEGDSIWLAYCGSWADIEPKNTCAVTGALLIPRQGPGDYICSVVTLHTLSTGNLA